MNESEVYPCPRCSGVNLTKKFALRKKLRHWSCKKCKGIMLSVDDINKLPFIGSRIIKKHNIEISIFITKIEFMLFSSD